MIYVKPSRDKELISNIIKHPVIAETFVDDTPFNINEYEPNISEHLYLLIYKNNTVIGVMICTEINLITLTLHIQILPEHRGKTAFKGAMKCLEWIWSKTRFLKVVAIIPTKYPNVINFTSKCGLEVEGISKDSFQKNNIIYDQVYMGLSRPGI